MIERWCVGIVITLIALGFTYGVSYLTGLIDEDFELGILLSWVISTIGFGVSLTMLLYTNQIIG